MVIFLFNSSRGGGGVGQFSSYRSLPLFFCYIFKKKNRPHWFVIYIIPLLFNRQLAIDGAQVPTADNLKFRFEFKSSGGFIFAATFPCWIDGWFVCRYSAWCQPDNTAALSQTHVGLRKKINKSLCIIADEKRKKRADDECCVCLRKRESNEVDTSRRLLSIAFDGPAPYLLFRLICSPLILFYFFFIFLPFLLCVSVRLSNGQVVFD